MSSVRIWTIVLFLLSGLLAYALAESILGTVRYQNQIKNSEAAVIEQLKIIREAQKLFLLSKGYYAPTWQELVSYVSKDTFYVVQKSETIIPRERGDKDFRKGDIVKVTLDTTQRLLVKDYLFPASQYPNFNAEKLGMVPGVENTYFQLQTRLDTIKNRVAFIEVVDTIPFDKTRSDENDNMRRRFLRFGSLSAVTLSGNWE
jgi:hypothetical protein